jgi:hypothetical protein
MWATSGEGRAVAHFIAKPEKESELLFLFEH